MERTRAITLATWLALVGACAEPFLGSLTSDETRPRPPEPEVAPRIPPPTCPYGAATYTSVLGLSSLQQQLSLAVDPGGHAWVADASGVTELSPAGAVVRSIPFGSLVAADPRGNVVLAGSFSSPIDLGLGLGTMTPEGNADVFVVELDRHGQVVFATRLGLCGDGLTALAIAGDGRIAISGSAMGTAILSRSGDLQLQLTGYGQLAFDSQGDLVIAVGDASSPPFLLAVDRNGAQVYEHVFDGAGVLMTGVTVDAADHVVFVGYTTDFIDVFGTYVQARSTTETGRVTGAFLGELDAGWPVFGLDLGLVEANGVATAHDGTIYVAGAQAGNTGFFRIATLGRLVAGALVVVNATSADGRDLAVAVDSCGNPLAAEIRLEPPTPPSTTDALVTKLVAP